MVTQCNDQRQASIVTEVSEWLLFNVNSAFCQLYHSENKLIFNEMVMMMSSALD